MLFEVIVDRGGSSGFGYLAVYSVLPFLAIMVLLDVILKLLITQKTSWIWMIEGFCSLGFVYYWIVR
jgi:hypothetical protein